MDGRNFRSCGGFTLVEVMVALLIVTLALAAAVELGTGSARQLEVLTATTRAHWVAMNRLEQLRATHMYPALGDMTGSDKEQGQRWYWKQTVTGGPESDLRVAKILVGTAPDNLKAASVHGLFSRELASPQVQQP